MKTMRENKLPAKTLAVLFGMSLIGSALIAQTNPNSDLFSRSFSCCNAINLELKHTTQDQPAVNPTGVLYSYLASQRCPSGRLYFEFRKVDARNNSIPVSYPDITQPISLPTLPNSWTESYDPVTGLLSSTHRNKLFIRLNLERNFILLLGEKLQFRVRCDDVDIDWSPWVTYCEGVDSVGIEDYFGGEPYRPEGGTIGNFFTPAPSPTAQPEVSSVVSGGISRSASRGVNVGNGGGFNVVIGGGGSNRRPGLSCSDSPLAKLSAPVLDDFREVYSFYNPNGSRTVRFTFRTQPHVTRAYPLEDCTRVMVKTADSQQFRQRGSILPPGATQFDITFLPHELPAEVVIHNFMCTQLIFGDDEARVISGCSDTKVVGTVRGCCMVEFGTSGLFWSTVFPDDTIRGPDGTDAWNRFFQLFGAQPVRPFQKTSVNNSPSGFGLGYVQTGLYPMINSSMHPPAFEWLYNGHDLTYISIPPGVRLTLYENIFYTGNILLDVQGPLLITFDPRYNRIHRVGSRFDCSKEFATSAHFSNVYNIFDFYEMNYKNSHWRGIYNYFPPHFRKFFHEVFPNHITKGLESDETRIATDLFTQSRSMVISKVSDICEDFVLQNDLPCGERVILNESSIIKNCDNNTVSFSWRGSTNGHCYEVKVTNNEAIPPYQQILEVRTNNAQNIPIRPGKNVITVTLKKNCRDRDQSNEFTFEVDCPYNCNPTASARLNCQNRLINWTANFSSQLSPCLSGCFELQLLGTNNSWITIDGINSQNLNSQRTVRLGIFPAYTYRVVYKRNCNDDQFDIIVGPETVSCGCPRPPARMNVNCDQRVVSLMIQPAIPTCNTGCFYLRQTFSRGLNQVRRLMIASQVFPQINQQIVTSFPLGPMPNNTPFTVELLFSPNCNQNAMGVVQTVRTTCLEPCESRATITASCEDVRANISLTSFRHCQTGCVVIQYRIVGENSWQNLSQNSVNQMTGVVNGNFINYEINTSAAPQSLREDHIIEYRAVYDPNDCTLNNTNGQRITEIVTQDCRLPCTDPNVSLSDLDCASLQMKMHFYWLYRHERCLVGCILLQRVATENIIRNADGTENWDATPWENVRQFTELSRLFNSTGMTTTMPVSLSDDIRTREYVYRTVYRPQGCDDSGSETPPYYLHHVNCPCSAKVKFDADCSSLSLKATVEYNQLPGCVESCFVLQRKLPAEDDDQWLDIGNVLSGASPLQITTPVPQHNTRYQYRLVRRTDCERKDGQTVVLSSIEEETFELECLKNCTPPSGFIRADCQNNIVTAQVILEDHPLCRVGCIVLQRRLRGDGDNAWQNVGSQVVQTNLVATQANHPSDDATYEYRILHRPEGCDSNNRQRVIDLGNRRTIEEIVCNSPCPPPTATIAANCDTRQVAATITFNAPERCLIGCFVLQWRLSGGNDAWQNAGTVNANQAGSGITAALPPEANNNALDYRLLYRPSGCDNQQDQVLVTPQVLTLDCRTPSVDCEFLPTVTNNCIDNDNSNTGDSWIISIQRPRGNCNGCLMLRYREIAPTTQDWVTVQAFRLANELFGSNQTISYEVTHPQFGDRFLVELVYRPNGCNVTQGEVTFTTFALPCGEICCPVHFTDRQWGPNTLNQTNPDGSSTFTSQPFVMDENSNFLNDGNYPNAAVVQAVLEDVIARTGFPGTLDGIAVPPGVRLEVFELNNFQNFVNPFLNTRRPQLYNILGPALIANNAQRTQGTYAPNGAGLNIIRFSNPNSERFFPAATRIYHNDPRILDPAFNSLPIFNNLDTLVVLNNTPARSIRITLVNPQQCPVELRRLCNARPPRPAEPRPVIIRTRLTCPTCPDGGSFYESFRLIRSEQLFSLDRGWHPRCVSYRYNSQTDACEIDPTIPPKCSRILLMSRRADGTVTQIQQRQSLVYRYRNFPLEPGEVNRFVRIEEFFCDNPQQVIFTRDYPNLFGQ